ncbi:tetratricopeptide TPR_2 repeat-containing protein [Chitinispirillum alkaliphilum]|nr:tetratricopeptide TPR_2 repeat-containing protein [Chitinispirillum alkaliphilum]
MKKKYQLLNVVCLLIFITMFCCGGLSHEEAFVRGNKQFEANNLRQAYSYYKRAIDMDGSNPLYHWAAAKSTSNRNLAFIHTQSAWDNGLKTFDILVALSALHHFSESDQALQHALSLYDQIPDSGKSHETLGDLFILFGEYDSSITHWKNARKKSPTSALCVKIAGAYAGKGQRDKAISYLENCRKEKQLDEQGYLTLAYYLAMNREYLKIDSIFNEAYRLGMYTSNVQLEHAGFALLQRDLSKAESLVSELGFIESERLLSFKARVMLASVFRSKNDLEKIHNLISSIEKGKIKPLEGEKELYLSIAGFINQDPNSLQRLANARAVLPQFSFIELLYARESFIEGNYREALVGYRNLPDFFAQHPQIVVEYAAVLARSGDDEQALALLSNMHRQKTFTRNSLELFRDLAIRNNLIHEGSSAQAVLEKLYANDVEVRYASAIIATQKGQLEKALGIMSRLYEEYPGKNQFGISKLRILYFKEDYSAIVEMCRTTTIPITLYGPVLARAFRKLGKNDLARSTYRDIISEDKNLITLLEYAQFNAIIGDFDEAVIVFDKIRHTFSEDLEKDSTKYAVILNNLAWSLLQSNQNPSLAQKIAEKANELLPGNIQIANTYATALLANRKYRRCISYIQNHPHASKSIRLMLHLARAFEKRGDINRAVRTYRDIWTKMNEEDNSQAPVTLQWLEEKITTLTTR